MRLTYRWRIKMEVADWIKEQSRGDTKIRRFLLDVLEETL